MGNHRIHARATILFLCLTAHPVFRHREQRHLDLFGFFRTEQLIQGQFRLPEYLVSHGVIYAGNLRENNSDDGVLLEPAFHIGLSGATVESPPDSLQGLQFSISPFQGTRTIQQQQKERSPGALGPFYLDPQKLVELVFGVESCGVILVRTSLHR